jgi:Ca2+-binding RTX toxin-like protein
LAGACLIALGVLLSILVVSGPPPAANAETGTKALALDSLGGANSVEAQRAAANGFTVTSVSDATWASMTKAQFADYQLIIVADVDSAPPAAVSQNAQALADAVMDNGTANTKAGNRILIGTDPVAHGGTELQQTGTDFAGVQEGTTGLYLAISNTDPDYDSNGQPDVLEKLLPLLSIDSTPNWTANTVPPCGGSASLISNANQFSSLSSSDLQGWNCSVHVSYPTFPNDWTALAIATDSPTQPTCGKDVDTDQTVCGEAYILIAGSGITAQAPNLVLTPPSDTNPVGSSHTVKAKVTNPDDTPRSGETVTFTVTGANAGASGTCVPANCATDGNGEVTFTYTGNNAGDDTINASITINGSTQTATAAKTWTSAPPSGVDLCFGEPATITSNGTVTGTNGNDVIITGNGNDTIDGRGGNDLICSRGGDDYVRGGTGNDRINSGNGNDNAGGQAGNDIVQSTGGNDDVQGGDGMDHVQGGEGNDTLNGGDGSDAVEGQGGNDLVAGNADAPDFCDGGSGTDATPANGGCESTANIP